MGKRKIFLKFFLLGRSVRCDSGFVLIVVLWILVILSMLALGLGRTTSVELALTKYKLGELRARFIAKGGLMYAIHQIIKDTKDEKTNQFDSLFQCAVKINPGQSWEEIFKDVPLGEGTFTIGYPLKEDETDQRNIIYGLEDEERKINLNAMDAHNYKILSALISLLEIDEALAQSIAVSVVDWLDEDSDVFDPPFGAENEYYDRLPKPYPCKNTSFDSPKELLLVRGMTPEIFDKLQNFVTIFPKETSLLVVNLNTAPFVVIRAVARSFTGAATNTTLEDADSLAEKIVAYRRGEDKQMMTPDDRVIDVNEIPLNTKEKVILASMQNNATQISHYLRIRVRGTDNISGASSEVEAVVFRDDQSILFEERN